jgi:hypothetical protein
MRHADGADACFQACATDIWVLLRRISRCNRIRNDDMRFHWCMTNFLRIIEQRLCRVNKIDCLMDNVNYATAHGQRVQLMALIIVSHGRNANYIYKGCWDKMTGMCRRSLGYLSKSVNFQLAESGDILRCAATVCRIIKHANSIKFGLHLPVQFSHVGLRVSFGNCELFFHFHFWACAQWKPRHCSQPPNI